MRVISQNGAIDVPYEMTAFHLAGGMIRMNMVGDTGKGTLMAQYETPEKAEKAMDILIHEIQEGKVQGASEKTLEIHLPIRLMVRKSV